MTTYTIPDNLPKQARTLGLSKIDFSLTYYLSGPMKGYPELNFPAFEAAMQQLQDSGLKILSPHMLSPDKQNPTDQDYLAYDFEMMTKHCQGIILLKGWPRSVGARAELEIALTLQWPVYYYNSWILTDMNGSPDAYSG